MSLRFAKQNRVRHSARLAIPRAARFRDPVPNPVLSSSQVLAVRKAQELEAVQSALRTKAKHVRYVETRDLTHYELALWNLHKTDAFCGALRLPRRAHATVPGWTEELQSTKSSCEQLRPVPRRAKVHIAPPDGGDAVSLSSSPVAVSNKSGCFIGL